MNKNLKKSSWEIIITFIGLGSLIFLIGKSRSLNFEQHQQYSNKIDQLQRKESDLKQTILVSRYELYVSYDPLVNNLKAQKEIQQQLENIPHFLDSKGQQEIRNILKERETLLAQKESLSEWFKTQNALLKNSLRYLPLLASQLGEKVGNSEEENTINQSNSLASLQIVFNDLLRNVLLYNITNNERIVPVVKQQIEKLTQLKEENQISEQEFPIQLAISHANIILTQKPQVEELTDQLLLSSPQQTKDLASLYSIYYQKARKTIRIYGLLRSGLFLMMVGWINYLFLRRLYRNGGKNSISQQTENVQPNPKIVSSAQAKEESKGLGIPAQNESVESAEKLEQIEGNEQSFVLESAGETEIIEPVDAMEKNDRRTVESIGVLEEKKDLGIPAQNESVASAEKLEQSDRRTSDRRTVESIGVLEEKKDLGIPAQNESVASAEKLEQIEGNEQSFVLESAGETETTEPVDAIATLQVYPFDSNNLQIWIRQIDRSASSILVRVRNHIKQKPCKMWFHRIARFKRDRIAKFRSKREKIR